jgi:hypothetical protein
MPHFAYMSTKLVQQIHVNPICCQWSIYKHIYVMSIHAFNTHLDNNNFGLCAFVCGEKIKPMHYIENLREQNLSPQKMLNCISLCGEKSNQNITSKLRRNKTHHFKKCGATTMLSHITLYVVKNQT